MFSFNARITSITVTATPTSRNATAKSRLRRTGCIDALRVAGFETRLTSQALALFRKEAPPRAQRAQQRDDDAEHADGIGAPHERVVATHVQKVVPAGETHGWRLRTRSLTHCVRRSRTSTSLPTPNSNTPKKNA